MDEVFNQPEAKRAIIKDESGVLPDFRGVRSIAFEIEPEAVSESIKRPPLLNEHGNSILRNDLGVSEEEINRLGLIQNSGRMETIL